ncbi:MAG: UbiD family decarboxylase, partial [Bacteroidetes bacterium]
LALRRPWHYRRAPFTALKALPRRVRGRVPVQYGRTTIGQLPQIVCWPMDGGAFITLPQVLTLPPGSRNIMESNLGMYRIQLSGNAYVPDREVGMHYQLHRGIGVHHAAYNQSDEPFRASIFVGGPPAHAFAAIMPLPEGLSELTFAGMLGGRRFRYKWHRGYVLSADADFVITGIIRKQEKKPEGPFGDHLGYYSLRHDFPVMEVEEVWHRKDAIWHFTVVGRPPQEDSSFGWLIHELVEPLTPAEFPGIHEVHAVDEAGVHPLLLAIGSERYMPFREKKPEELLTQANHLLGKGQTSLAKYLLIAERTDDPGLHTHDTRAFFRHVLERVDLSRDLHFYTKTTIDTLDYSGTGWNEGSKLVIAVCGPVRRQLWGALPAGFDLPKGFGNPKLVAPGILAVEGPAFTYDRGYDEAALLADQLGQRGMEGLPLVVLCDDADFLAADWSNFLWAAFTRSNPSHDVHGARAQCVHKHWSCAEPLVIDARSKPHHAPPLELDPAVVRRVEDRFFRKGKPLARWG